MKTDNGRAVVFAKTAGRNLGNKNLNDYFFVKQVFEHVARDVYVISRSLRLRMAGQWPYEI